MAQASADTDAKDLPELLQNDDDVTFEKLGLVEPLCNTLESLGWKKPSKIQQEAIPIALDGNDVIGVAETGSGKTGAFCLPILQSLLKTPKRLFALVLAPTRELVIQIDEQFKALGSAIGIKTCAIVGGINMQQQVIALAKKPHVVVATPGRLVDHLEKTKGFSLRNIKYLVLDEADRILNMDFEAELDKILGVIPRERNTFLFSATMTNKVKKLQRAALTKPVKCEVHTKFHTVETLKQYYIFVPEKMKDAYLTAILNEFEGKSTIVFCSTCKNTQRVAYFLRNLGISAIPLHGQMSQPKRLGALTRFKSNKRSVLIATDVASRGLDIKDVDLVVNLEIPTHSKDYIHRIGRTARAGKSGVSIAILSQYEIELYQRIEDVIKKKLPKYEMKDDEVEMLQERVEEARRLARQQIKEEDETKKMKRKRGIMGGDDDDEGDELSNFNKKLKFGKKKKR